MATDEIRYDLLTRQALRGMVRGVLAQTAKQGLPGNHHFFIAFDTRAEGVRISARLREQYPGNMTIVLQHEFWDLTVSDDVFEVGLSFKGVRERLRIPFDALTGFFDPSVQFGLQFEDEESDKDAAATDGNTAAAQTPAATQPTQLHAREPAEPVAKADRDAREKPGNANPDKPDPDGPKPDKPGGAEVVRLDRFRKK
ncbi:MAG TPA: ClpXP protease specificity-enhancing factor SspB [Xanthobacteraceae bacterium]|jgi:hypothetical protein|nr:ClpXP protease specificity-enhancing factor SspB [Xanthobacteraceae bacterium]